MLDQDLNWEKCVCLCTDRSASMTGCHLGATEKIKKSCKQKSAVYTLHIVLYTLASQKLSPELNDIMIRPVKIINYS